MPFEISQTTARLLKYVCIGFITLLSYNYSQAQAGITWDSQTSATDNAWQSVTYGSGLFVAVAQTGTGNRVMTSGTFVSLPVQWISFTAKNINGKHELRWQTANETNNLTLK